MAQESYGEHDERANVNIEADKVEQLADSTPSYSPIDAAGSPVSAMLGNPGLGERSNQPFRSAMLQRMQQTYGNRAMRRFVQRGARGTTPPLSGPFVQRHATTEDEIEEQQPTQLMRASRSAVPIQRHPEGAELLEGKEEAVAEAEETKPPAEEGDPPGSTPGKGSGTPAPGNGTPTTGTTGGTPTGATPTGDTTAKPAPATTPAPAPATSRFMELARAQEVLQKFVGTTRTIVPGKIEILEDREAAWAKYDEVCIAANLTNKFVTPNRKWQAGDSKVRSPGLDGFAWKGVVYVNKQTKLATATAHEMLHNNAEAGWRSAVGEQINEGTTEHLAILALKAESVPVPTHAYPKEVELVEKIASVVGIATVKSAYFGGAQTLKDAVDKEKGTGKWTELKGFADAKKFTEAKALLDAPKATPTPAPASAPASGAAPSHTGDPSAEE